MNDELLILSILVFNIGKINYGELFSDCSE